MLNFPEETHHSHQIRCFLSGNRQGFYFTEPYDSKRILAVLVYGMGGSPQDWRYVIEHFDLMKYQFWFYH